MKELKNAPPQCLVSLEPSGPHEDISTWFVKLRAVEGQWKGIEVSDRVGYVTF